MEPVEYMRALRRRWWIVAVATVLAAVAAWMTTPSPDSVPEEFVYQATHTLYDDPLESSNLDVGLNTVELLATTGEIPRRVVERLGDNVEPAVLAEEMSISADQELGTLRVRSSDPDPDRAVELANTWAVEVQRYFDERQQVRTEERITRLATREVELEEQVRALDSELAALPEDTSDAELVRAERDALLRQYSALLEQREDAQQRQGGGAGLVTLEAAVAIPQSAEGGFQAPTSGIGRAGIGMAVGMLLGIALAMFVDRTDTRIQTRSDAERAFGLPVLAEVPRMRKAMTRDKIVTVTNPGSFPAESYRILRLALQLAPRWVGKHRAESANGHLQPGSTSDQEPFNEVQVVLITSAAPGEGKTTTVANIAASYAEIGKRVLVLDCDFRNPHQHDYFDVPRSPGVADYLTRGERRPSLAALAQATSVPGVRVVANGTESENPGELMGPDVDLIAEARSLADIIVIDAGPLLAVNDPSALIPKADAVLATARSGRTTRDFAERTAELLQRIGAPVVGVALVSVPRGAAGQPYYAQTRSVPTHVRRGPVGNVETPESSASRESWYSSGPS